MHQVTVYLCILCRLHAQAAQLTAEEKAAFKQVFDSYDENKDGHISSSEVKTVLNKLGQYPTDEEIAEFIKVCDVDKNGTIEFNEFCRSVAESRRKVSQINCNTVLCHGSCFGACNTTAITQLYWKEKNKCVASH